jgi:hypothetical protein
MNDIEFVPVICAQPAHSCTSRERGRKAPRVNRRARKSRRGPVAAEALSRSRRLKKRLVLRCNIAADVKKSSLSLGIDHSVRNVEAGRSNDFIEERTFGRSHPHLAAALQPSE